MCRFAIRPTQKKRNGCCAGSCGKERQTAGYQTIDISENAERNETAGDAVKKAAETADFTEVFVHNFISVKMTYQYVR